MDQAVHSIYAYVIYLIGLAGTLLLMPNLPLSIIGLPETHEVWIRIAGFAPWNLILFTPGDVLFALWTWAALRMAPATAWGSAGDLVRQAEPADLPHPLPAGVEADVRGDPVAVNEQLATMRLHQGREGVARSDADRRSLVQCLALVGTGGSHRHGGAQRGQSDQRLRPDAGPPYQQRVGRSAHSSCTLSPAILPYS